MPGSAGTAGEGLFTAGNRRVIAILVPAIAGLAGLQDSYENAHPTSDSVPAARNC